MSALSRVSCTRSIKTLGMLAAVAIIAGCAKPQPSADFYDTSRENTQGDAQNQAMGTAPRAQSQIQLGFGRTGEEEAAARSQEDGAEPAVKAATPRPLAEARSFLGTVPCPQGLACEVSRFVVTLAPSGEWRSRTTMLVNNQPANTLTEQGCWNVIGENPLRIALMHAAQETAKADLTFLNNNTLRVNTLNGVQPVLQHRLTRQADIDPIDELSARPALLCD